MIELSAFPAINAALNGASALLLVAGYGLIRKKQVQAHAACMIAAFIVSCLFLVSYLYYHFHHGSTPFQGKGTVRLIYFALLLSHTVLAAAVPPLALVTLRRAFRGEIQKHVRVARVAFPVWLYVSVTGVVIYAMLYRISW